MLDTHLYIIIIITIFNCFLLLYINDMYIHMHINISKFKFG